MKTTEYIEKTRKRTNSKSDYELAKKLGISTQRISDYTNGKRIIDDYTAIKIAEALNIDPMQVIATANAEREKSEDRKLFWEKLSKQLGGVAASLLFFTIALPHAGVSAMQCILC